MGKTTPFPVESFLYERPDPAGLPDRLMCIDDRFNLLRMLSWQLAGGPDGLGRDMAIARETKSPDSFVSLNKPVHWMAAKVTRYLGNHGITAYMHHDCAAYMKALIIRRTICEEPETVFEQTKVMETGVTESEFEQTVEAGRRFLGSQLIKPYEEADRDLLEGVQTADNQLPAVPRLTLARGPHLANDFIVDYGTNVVWRADKAYKAGYPAYYAGLGMLRNVQPLFAHYVDHRPLYVASAVRHAAISLKLPRPLDEPLNIHVRNAA